MKSTSFSSLSDKLHHYLIDHKPPSKQSVEVVISNDPLVLVLLQYKQSTMFVSDLHTSIQFTIVNPNAEQQMDYRLSVNANNHFESRYYRKLDEKYYCFWEPHNCRHQELIDKPVDDYPHPYEPQFYMPDMSSFREFKRKGQNVMVSSKIVRINTWKIKIVNVSETGWYAPVIQAISHKIEGPAVNRNFKEVSMVMYEKPIRQLMEKFRLGDLRKNAQLSNSWAEKVGMTYHMKQMVLNQKRKEANFYVVDEDNKMLKFDEERKKQFLPFGKMTQNIVLNKPVGKMEIDQQKITRMNLDFFKYVERHKDRPNPANEQAVHVQTKDYQGKLWSSSDEGSEEDEYGGKEQRMRAEQPEVVESESDEEDPLRKLYFQQVKHNLLK